MEVSSFSVCFFLIVAAICFIFRGSNLLSVQFLTVLLMFLGS